MGRPKAALPRVQVRMTEDLRTQLQTRAEANFWNINAEIVMLLKRGLAANETASAPQA